MLIYICQRLLQGAVVLLGVSMVVFFLVNLTGDPAAMLLPLNTPEEDVKVFRHQMGFDRPLVIQYGLFISRAVKGDFGYSYRHRTPAMPLVLARLPATLKLTAIAFLFAFVFAVPAGILAALRPNTLLDSITRTFTMLGQAIPGFWLAIMLILIFAVRLRWLPVSGTDSWKSLVLPGITVGSFIMATITRLLRSSLLEVLGENYIRTAHAKGLRRPTVLLRHAMKNAAIPVVTVIGLQITFLIGGSIIAEAIFAYPGIGRLAYQAIATRDIPVIQAYVAVVATITVLINIIVDVAYTWLDPRVRL